MSSIMSAIKRKLSCMSSHWSDTSESEDEELPIADETTENICSAIKQIVSDHRPDRRRASRSKPSSTTKVCRDCEPNRYFKLRKVLERHRALLHDSSRPQVSCEWCGQQFYTQTQADIHKRLYKHDKQV